MVILFTAHKKSTLPEWGALFAYTGGISYENVSACSSVILVYQKFRQRKSRRMAGGSPGGNHQTHDSN